MRNASSRDYTRYQFFMEVSEGRNPNFPGNFRMNFDYLASIFKKISFARNFPTNLEQDLWDYIPKFSENFGVKNFLEILG